MFGMDAFRRLAAAARLVAAPAAAMLMFAGGAHLALAADLAISPVTLPGGQVNAAYDQTLTAAPSGMGPYAWSISSGALPAGLALTSSTTETVDLAGTPSAGGSFAFTVAVSDGAGDTPASQSYSLTIAKLSPVITWADPAAITYGTALGSTQLDATAGDVNGQPLAGQFSYQPDAGAVLEAGTGIALNATFTPTNSEQYSTASATAHITVTAADTSLTVPDVTGVYNQGALSLKANLTSTATVSGGTVGFAVLDGSGTQVQSATSSAVAGGTGAASFNLNNLATGSYTIDATYSGSSNFNSSAGSGTLTINKATPHITWKPPATLPYGTALGSSELNATTPVAGSFTYSPDAGAVLTVGPQQVSASFTPTDTANYNPATLSQTITIVRAKPDLYFGAAVPAGRVTPVWTATWGDSQVTLGTTVSSLAMVDEGTVTYTIKHGTAVVKTVQQAVSSDDASISLPLGTMHAGTYGVSMSYSGSSLFTNAVSKGTLTIAKAAPAIIWGNSADIYYGVPLTAAQLNAQVTLNGSLPQGHLAYSPAPGKVLPLGLAQALKVSFTPTDRTDILPVSATVYVNVLQAPTSLFVSNLAPAKGARAVTLLAHVVSNGTVRSGAGTFTISDASGSAVASVSAGVAGGVESARLSLAGLPAGTYTISAAYNGTPQYAPSQGQATLTIS